VINLETLRAVLELDVSKFSSAAKQAQKEAQGFGKGLEDNLSKTVRNATIVGNVAAEGAMQLLRMGTAGFRAGLQAASGAEQANIAFTQFFKGNADAAMRFQKQLEEFAARTPFEFPQLRQAASSMMAVGVSSEKVIPILTTVGDAISSIGGGADHIQRATIALQQMAQKGKVTAEEMLQLTEAGIPAWDALAAELGTDVAGAMKLVEKRTVDAATMFSALEKKSGSALQNMAGMMDVQARSFQGMMSTFKDTVSMAAGEMLRPLMRVVTRELPNITKMVGDELNAIGPTVARVGELVVTSFARMLPVIGPVLEGVVKLAAKIAEALLPALEKLAPFAGQAATILLNQLGKALDVVGPALAIMAERLGPDMPKIASALGELAKAAADLFVAASPLLATLIELKTQVLVTMAGYLTDILGAITPLAGAAADSDAAMRGLVGAYLAFKAVGVIKTAVDGMLALKKAIDAVTISTAWKTLVDNLDTIRLHAMYAADAIKAIRAGNVFSSLVAVVSLSIPVIASYAAAWWSAAAGVIAATWPVLLAVAAIAALAAAAVWAYKNVGWFHDAVDAVGRVIAQVWNDYLVPFGGWLTGTLVPAITGVASAIWDFVSNWQEIPGKVGGALAQLPGLVAGFLGNVIGWLAGMAGRIASTVLGWVGSFLAWIPGAIAQLPGQLAYLAGFVIGFLLGMIARMAVTMVAGAVALVKWVWDALPGLLGALGGLASAIWGWITSVAATLPGLLWGWALQFLGWVVATAGQIGGWLGSVAGAIWDWVSRTAAELPGNLWNWAVQFLGWVINVAANLPGWLASVASSIWGWVGRTASELPGQLYGWLIQFSIWCYNLASQFPGWLGRAKDAIWNWITGLPGALAGALGSALDIGRSIVEGIWKGIQNAAGWLAGLVGNFAKGILDGMKKAIGFGSPAKKFMPLGESIAQGMAVGIKKAAHLVHEAAGALIPDPDLGAFSVAGAVRGIGGGALAGAGVYTPGGAPVTVNVNGRATIDQGADVVAAIAAYERANGTTWRTGTPTLVEAGW
jgi:tape measure domain-containing protein